MRFTLSSFDALARLGYPGSNGPKRDDGKEDAMKRATWTRIQVAIGAAATAAALVTSAHGQVTKTAPPPNRNITLAGPQPHNPGSGGQHALPGRIEGFVYWDAQTVTHKPTGTCDGFSVTVTSGGIPVGNPSAQFGAKYVGQVKAYLVGGNVLVYDVCTYAYSNVPEGPQLQVQLNMTQTATFSPVVAPAGAVVGPVTVINAQCNMLPNIVNPTLSDLKAHWGSCQNMAYDVNFVLQPSAHLLGGPGTRGQLLSGPSTTPLLKGTTPNAIRPSGTSASLSPQSSGPQAGANGGGIGGVNPGNTVQLNPQPFPPKGTPSAIAHEAVKPVAVRLAPPKALRKIVNPRLGAQDAALFGLLRQQRQIADQRSAQLVPALAGAPSSKAVATSRAPAPSAQLQPNASTQQFGPETTQDATSGFQISDKHYAEPVAIACMKDPTARIISAPLVFTPEAKYDSYSIEGCGLGPSSAANRAYIFGANGFRENLMLDFWSDHDITVHMDPALSGVPDQDNLTLVVAPAGKQEMQKPGIKFYAARQESLLGYDSLTQSQVSLHESSAFLAGHFEQIPLPQLNAGYDQLPSNAASQFPSFSFQGAPVAGWVFRYAYGHYDNSGEWDCYMNDVHSVSPSTATEGPCMNYFNYLYYATEGGTDVWTFPLAPGFAISSYELYYEDTDARTLCGAWDEVSHKDGHVGKWDFNLAAAPNNTIIVNWPAYYCTDQESAPVNRVNTQYQSAYGLAVWAAGPRGINPWTGKSTGQ